MIKASLIDKATGTVFGRISTMQESDLDLHRTDTVDVVLGWDVEPMMLNAADIQANDVRARRNQLLDNSAWTIRADSPLTSESIAAWLLYMKQLQRLTVDYPTGEPVWPEPPSIDFLPLNQQ